VLPQKVDRRSTSIYRTISGLSENNFVEITGANNEIAASALANASGIATIDISSASIRPPYHKMLIWTTNAKTTLLYENTVGTPWANDIWGGDSYVYEAGTDPDGAVAFVSSSTRTDSVASHTGITLHDTPSWTDFAKNWTPARLFLDSFRDQTLKYDDKYGVLTAPCPYKIEGVTRNSSGVALGGCTVILVKTQSDGKPCMEMLQMTTSDVDGNYQFFVRDNVTEYSIIAWKAGVSNVFGRTDKNIKGVTV